MRLAAGLSLAAVRAQPHGMVTPNRHSIRERRSAEANSDPDSILSENQGWVLQVEHDLDGTRPRSEEALRTGRQAAATKARPTPSTAWHPWPPACHGPRGRIGVMIGS